VFGVGPTPYSSVYSLELLLLLPAIAVMAPLLRNGAPIHSAAQRSVRKRLTEVPSKPD
jgi:hypothetical protein